MADKTAIEWTDATWNPIRGCSLVSDGCKNCYAMHVAARFNGAGLPYEGLTVKTSQGPKWNGKIMLVPEALHQPGRWSRPRKIFVNSMSDLFHEGVPEEYIDAVFSVMAQNPRHTFQVLTKRADRMQQYMSDKMRLEKIYLQWHGTSGGPREAWGWPLPNVWLGVSVENQKTANERVPLLLQTPAAVRWISGEPLLGQVDLNNIPHPLRAKGADWVKLKALATNGVGDGIHWVVVGGESGHSARPMHPDWARSLRDQCAAAGVPFLFKQWGEFTPIEISCGEFMSPLPRNEGEQVAQPDGTFSGKPYAERFIVMRHVGKKAAGRLLDGVQHDGYPETTA